MSFYQSENMHTETVGDSSIGKMRSQLNGSPLSTQTQTEDKLQCYSVFFPTAVLIKFPFLVMFSQEYQNHFGTQRTNLMFRFKKKKVRMALCSVLTKVWQQTVFIPNNSCVEEVTVLEEQMIGDTPGRERYEGRADSWT